MILYFQLKPKIEDMMMPPIDGRRALSFTRDSIKSLISKDEDIKKILKDLVRVTMSKVDLNTRKATILNEKVIDRKREKEEDDQEMDKKEDDDFLEAE